MRKKLTFGLAAVVLGATLSYVGARSRLADPEAVVALPPHDMLERVRAMGLEPLGAPTRHGQYYVVQAYDIRGRELRVVADVHYGDILSAAPVPATTGSVPHYDRGPRIIHVPQPGEPVARASVNSREKFLEEDDGAEAAPPPRPRAAPKPQRRSDAPAAEPRRRPFSASPPAETSLTPIRPTPRFGEKPVRQITGAAKQETGVKFPPALPPGYTPPAAPPEPAAIEPDPAATENDADVTSQ